MGVQVETGYHYQQRTKPQMINLSFIQNVLPRPLRALHRGPVVVPTALALLSAEFHPMPIRRLAEQAYNLQRLSQMEAGCDFAAMEEPLAFEKAAPGFIDGYFA
jgi:hypothetical protein